MQSNVIEKYELIDGWAIIDNNFQVISANESFYRFVGIARCYTMMDVIHQVDMDDFIEVANSLRVGSLKSMVLRMRRIDNSYRWILVDVRRAELHQKNEDGTEGDCYEYLELKMSDIQAMQKQNYQLNTLLKEYSHLLAMEGELIFSIDYATKEVTLLRFMDDEITTVYIRPMKDIEQEYIDNKLIPDEDIPEFEAFCSDIREGVATFVHRFNVVTTPLQVLASGEIELKGTTFFNNNMPVKILGTLRQINGTESYTRNLITHEAQKINYKKADVLNYVRNSMEYNAGGEILLLILQIDNLDLLRELNGKRFAESLFDTVMEMAKEKVGFRGVVGDDDNNIVYMAIKDMNLEVNARAFIESLRSMITWKYRVMNESYRITFSIGVSRYPFNGKGYDNIVRKAERALLLANQKGKNRFIIYKETLHGEL